MRGLSFSVASGQLCAVMGPNGAGKSSLLRLLSGEWKPCAGEVRVGGRPLESWSLTERARLRAVLVQDRLAGLPMTVGELMVAARRCHGPRQDALFDQQIGLLALRTLGAVDLVDRLVTRLSGAEERRVQIAALSRRCGRRNPAASGCSSWTSCSQTSIRRPSTSSFARCADSSSGARRARRAV